MDRPSLTRHWLPGFQFAIILCLLGFVGYAERQRIERFVTTHWLGEAAPIDGYDYFGRMRRVLAIVQEQIEPGDTVLIGDSIAQGMAANSQLRAVNLGVSGARAADLAQFIAGFTRLNLAGTIYLEGGINDLLAGSPEQAAGGVRAALAKLPPEPRVIASGVLPINPDRLQAAKHPTPAEIGAVSAEIARLCAARPNCVFVDVSAMSDAEGRLAPAYDRGDGIHLSRAGYDAWTGLLLAAARSN